MNKLLLIAFLFFSKFLLAQTTTNPVVVNRYYPAIQKVYLLTDKVIYTPNEPLWFSAYVLHNNSTINDSTDIITVALHNPVSNDMVVLRKFLMHKNFATGSILIPDSLVAGTYNLVAYTNVLNPDHVPVGIGFKPLSIYDRNGKKTFTSLLNIIDSLSTGTNITVEHKMISSNYQVNFKDAIAWYQLNYGKKRKIKLTNYGSGIINIKLNDNNKNPGFITTTTICNDDTVKNQIKLTTVNHSNSAFTANFYPEGNLWTNGQASRVFWEVTQKNKVASTKAFLLENGKIINTIFASPNQASWFTVNPKPNHQYAVRIPESEDTVYQLPITQTSALRIRFPKLVVNDSLHFEFFSKEKRTVQMIIVDINDAAVYSTLSLIGERKVKALLKGLPRGLCKIFIVDETGATLAKSYFFARYNEGNKTNLETDKSVYKTRDSVTIKIKVTNALNEPQNAVATISCALISRVDFSMVKNIESDFALSQVLYNEQSFLKRNNILDSTLLLEHILRMKIPPEDGSIYLNETDNPKIVKPSVYVALTYFDKVEEKAIDVVLIKDGAFSFLRTDEGGTFNLSTNELLVNEGRKIFLKGMGKKNAGYKFKTDDSLIAASKNIIVPTYQPLKRTADPDMEALLKTDVNEKFSQVLETVIVKSKKDYGGSGRANACGDYVCQYNILNCPNHIIPFKEPIKGERYGSAGSGQIIYQGCDEENSLYLPSFTPVYLSRKFLGMDSTLLKQDFPEYLSTLYWQPFTTINKEGDNEVHFNTSDQEGVYLLTVQGFADNGYPFYAEKIIHVKKDN